MDWKPDGLLQLCAHEVVQVLLLHLSFGATQTLKDVLDKVLEEALGKRC